MVEKFLSGYRTEARDDTEAKALQEALLIKFRQSGLVGCIENATGFPYHLWSNFNESDKPRYSPHYLNEWLVDIHKARAHYWENRVVGCRNPASDWLNTSGYIYGSDLVVWLFKWEGGQRHYVFVHFSMDKTLRISGLGRTFSDKLTDEDGHLERQKVMLALLQAMDKPLPDEQDLIEKKEREAAASVA